MQFCIYFILTMLLWVYATKKIPAINARGKAKEKAEPHEKDIFGFWKLESDPRAPEKDHNSE